MVYHLALQLLSNHDDALDLSQDVFLTVFRSIHRFRGDSALQTWICRIVINHARNRQRWWRRRRRADQVSLDALIEERGELPAPLGPTSPDRALDQKQLGERVWRALNRLPFDQRSAVVLRELHGMRYAEIAFSLGVSNAAVKSRLARAPHVANGVATAMTPLTSPGCRTVRTWLTAAHDDELSVRRHVLLDGHLTSCASCRGVRDDLTSLGTALREGAARHRPDEAAFARLAPEVMARKTMESDARWHHRVGDVIDDGQRLWMIGCTLAATVAGALVVVAAVLGLTAPTHPGSLAGLMRTSAALGSNANPLWLVAGVTLPRVAADTRAKAMPIQPLRPLGIPNLALTAVVTREGQLASVHLIHDGVPDAALTRAVSRLASDVRFEPARARGAPVAVNVVWLLERTTVAATPIPDLAHPVGGD